MTVWKQLDEMKARFECELGNTKAHVEEKAGKRAANTVRCNEAGHWVCTANGDTITAPTSRQLLERLAESLAQRDAALKGLKQVSR